MFVVSYFTATHDGFSFLFILSTTMKRLGVFPPSDIYTTNKVILLDILFIDMNDGTINFKA